MKVIKRNNARVDFDRDKIFNAISKANEATKPNHRITEDDIDEIVNSVVETLDSVDIRIVDVEDIQNLVEVELMKAKAYRLAQNYAHYRSKRESHRSSDEMIDKIFSLVNDTNEEMNTENANKDVRINSTKRDYISGIVSIETLGRMLKETYKKASPKGKEIIKEEDLDKILVADNKGVIHNHDKDYFIQPMYNCALINLEDMLENGTVISGTTIDKPNSFYTAANITTQIIAQVASNQYGGQSITMSHLAPFVDISRQKLIAEVREEFENNRIDVSEDKIRSIAERRLKKEIQQGVQTIQYQVTTLMTTNGQAPFLTVFLYTGEVEEGQTRDDLALIIEEVLKQRIKGVKDENGTWVNPTFPKLIFALDEDNVPKDSKYRYLFDLAAECSSKRMVPDYISVKKMKELKNGDVYPPMGCLDYNETIFVSLGDTPYRQKQGKDVKIGDLYEHLVIQGNNSSHYKGSKLLNRAKNIKNEEDKEKFLENGYLVYSGSHFNLWASQFKEKHGRKPTRQDFKDIAGIEWDRDSVMKNRGADLRLVSKWDSYLECKVCDVLNANNCNQVYFVDNSGKFDYIRNKIFTCKDGSRKQVDIFFPYFNTGFEINDFTTHDRYSDTAEYTTENGYLCHVKDYGGYKKGPAYSKEKISKLKELGIEVYEIWEDEVRNGDFVEIINKVLKTNFSREKKSSFDLENKFDVNTPDVVCYDLEENGVTKYVRDIDGSFTKIKKIMRNSNISNWLKITTPNRAITLTSDHPLIIETGQVIADELNVGDYILNDKDEREYITNIEKLEKIDFSYDIETESNSFVFSGVQSHNCRSLLTPDDGTANKNNKAKAKNYIEGEHKYYGRFNQGVVTLNLPYIALEAHGDIDKFWELFDEYTELAHSALRLRHERLLGTKSDVAPILWQFGAIARLDKGEKIDKLLYGNYSTISLGYAGIYEMTQALLGVSHTTEKGREFALEVMKKLNDKCEQWKEDENISYSIYGTPMESGTYKFAKSLKREFGEVPEVSEYNYITNSYHVNVREEISAVDKIVQESQFQALSPGGAISYVEVPNLSKNLDVVKTIMEAIYDNIIYAEINTKMDHCEECGYDGEIFLVEDEYGELVWECPNCGNRNVNSMNIVRRVCGYLGNASKGLNSGRLGEIHDRVLHVSNLVD